MRRWKAHRGKIASLSFSRDGQLLASVTGSGRDIFIWDATAGELARKLTVEDVEGRHTYAKANAVAFAPDAELLAVVREHWVEVWNTTDWRRAGEAPTWFPIGTTGDYPPIGTPYEVSVGSGAIPFIAASTSDLVSVWSSGGKDDRPLRYVTSWRIGNVSQVSFSHDGSRVATHTTRDVEVRELPSGGRFQAFAHRSTNYAGPVRFSPDSSRLAFCYSKVIESHPATLDDPNAVIRYAGHTDKVWVLRYTPDGRTLISASGDGTVRLWEASTGLEKRCFDMKIGKIAAADVSPDGAVAAVGGANGEIVVWDLE